MRRVWLLLSLGLLLRTPALAGMIADHLIPIAPDLSDFGSVRDYKLAVVRRLLGQRPGVGPYAVVFPSFEREWALQVGTDRGEPFALLVEANVSMWAAMHQHAAQHRVAESDALLAMEVPTRRNEAALSPTAGREVIAAWRAMLNAAHAPTEQRIGLDGTAYLFFGQTASETPTAGYVWSPRQGTPTGTLVDLLDTLRRYAQAPDEQRAGLDEALVRMAKLVQHQAGSEAP
jgi:hypothetical protein